MKVNKFSNLIEKEREEERGGREFPGLRNTMVSNYVFLSSLGEGEKRGEGWQGVPRLKEYHGK